MTVGKFLRIPAIAGAFLFCVTSTLTKEVRHLKLEEAVRLAMEKNRALKIARLKVTENQDRKSAARSDYFPVITNQSNALYISELQNIVIPAGSLGVVSGTAIPTQPISVQQGKQNLYSSGTMIAQPITQLLRVHAENRVAAAEVATSRDELKNAENEVALKVHALYFGILVAQLQKQAAEQETSFAAESLRENENGIRNGSALQVAEMQSRAQFLQGKQEVLTAELQIDDYMTELDDLLGLPLDTQLELDPDVATRFEAVTKEDYVKAAWEGNPEIRSAQQAVEKARAGVSAAKTAYIPDVIAYARYSYQDGVPFFVKNFGTFGVNLSYTLWDFGKRHAAVNERETQLAEAEENLERLKEHVAVEVERSYNKLERTKSMVDVATQVAKLRAESERLTTDQAAQGVVLISDVRNAAAANYKAKADLLQASLGYLLARAELERTVGRAPGLETP
ncbi:MAG TPA: TolC family protein [Candidatus Sulfotelmatobacter sp.]|nr:TolC family protein [Candidatus Sulfotelmatobacter sp.]